MRGRSLSICASTAWHEGGHLTLALMLGVPVVSASATPGASRVELGPLDRVTLNSDTLHRLALVAAGGPASDQRFDPRGLRGYCTASRRNDLNKVARLAILSREHSQPFTARAALAEAGRILDQARAFHARAAGYLRAIERLEGRTLAAVARECGAGVSLPGYGRWAA